MRDLRLSIRPFFGRHGISTPSMALNAEPLRLPRPFGIPGRIRKSSEKISDFWGVSRRRGVVLNEGKSTRAMSTVSINFGNATRGLSLRETVCCAYGALDSFLRFDPALAPWANLCRTYGALKIKMPPPGTRLVLQELLCGEPGRLDANRGPGTDKYMGGAYVAQVATGSRKLAVYFCSLYLPGLNK
jgi:hypothetical protein